jgi:hypothetical protein
MTDAPSLGTGPSGPAGPTPPQPDPGPTGPGRSLVIEFASCRMVARDAGAVVAYAINDAFGWAVMTPSRGALAHYRAYSVADACDVLRYCATA